MSLRVSHVGVEGLIRMFNSFETLWKVTGNLWLKTFIRWCWALIILKMTRTLSPKGEITGPFAFPLNVRRHLPAESCVRVCPCCPPAGSHLAVQEGGKAVLSFHRAAEVNALE